MAEPTQFAFSFADIAKLMFQASNIHEGKWVVGIEYTIAIGNVGIVPTEAFPGAIIGAQRLLLTEAGAGPQPPNLIFDAAEVNPKKSKK